MMKNNTKTPRISLHALIRAAYGLLLLSLPFSVGANIGSIEINLPSEPLLAILSILLLLWFYRNEFFGRSLRKAPLMLASVAWISWMIAMVPFSDLPLVSVKYVLVTTVHWWVFYIGFLVIIHDLSLHLYRYFLAYALPFAGVLIYAWTVHAQYQFSIDSSVLVARPFYFDHALYSCCLLLLLGPFAVWVFQERKKGTLSSKVISGALVLLFLIGLYLSFSRAAWLSCIMSGVMIGVMILFKMRFKLLMIISIATSLVLVLATPFLLEQAAVNKAESKKGDLFSQIISVGNISTDVSNLERINRYSCAWRMFLDRPVFGHGPGTYQFAYLPYQRPEERTRISVTHSGPHGPGRGGGAHSEYLQALSESGLPGAVLWIALLFSSIFSALLVFHSSSPHRWLAMGILFSLITYFIHGFFNNFLHHDKLAILVWGGLATLTLLERNVMINGNQPPINKPFAKISP